MSTNRSTRFVTALGLGAALAAVAGQPVLAASTKVATATKKTVKKATTSAPVFIDGPAVDTRWGVVQVSVTVANHKLTDVSVPVYPDHKNRSVQINDRALPILHDEAIAAQSARIANVSGATVTWDGYTVSLQKALDTARQQGVL